MVLSLSKHIGFTCIVALSFLTYFLFFSYLADFLKYSSSVSSPPTPRPGTIVLTVSVLMIDSFFSKPLFSWSLVFMIGTGNVELQGAVSISLHSVGAWPSVGSHSNHGHAPSECPERVGKPPLSAASGSKQPCEGHRPLLSPGCFCSMKIYNRCQCSPGYPHCKL